MSTPTRVLVSADAHGGAPPCELDLVLARGGHLRQGPVPRTVSPPNAAKKDYAIHPEDRIREQQLDGVVAEAIYGYTGFFGESFEDALPRIRATNDWSAEVYGAHLGRFAPSIALPLPIEPYGGKPLPIAPTEQHIAAAADEIRRAPRSWACGRR